MMEIKCSECKKVIGQYVQVKVSYVSGLGAIPLLKPKYDYRKASNIGLGLGLICKGCAKRFFPNGYAYRVTVNYHGKRISPCVGINRMGLFATKAEAQKAADDMNRRDSRNYAMVSEEIVK